MTRSASLIQSNSQVYRIYSRRLSNPADPQIFITAARKLTTFLSDERAYYDEAQQPIIEILEIACNSLKNVVPNVFSKPGSLDRSAIPADKAPLFDAFNRLANSVTPYVSLFSDTTLNSKQRFMMLHSV
ncbi:hypothetical protein BGY98DRAFT_980571 [Russula aff. rugulosa BPL654]|nr:hypothetical protein BGY98DRAFT_980571 [Russula aff. rugulosa BPL654]